MIAATRTLQLRTDNGSVPVVVNIHVPSPDDRSWACVCEIGWPEGKEVIRALGLDGLQALQLAMDKAAVHLYGSKPHRDGLLTWDGAPGYGLRLPRPARALAVGEDKLL